MSKQPKPPPPHVTEPTGIYIKIPPELVPPEIAARIAEHVERGRELVGLVLDVFGKAQKASTELQRDAKKLQRRRPRQRRSVAR